MEASIHKDEGYDIDVDYRHSNNCACVGESDAHQKAHPGVKVILKGKVRCIEGGSSKLSRIL